MVSKFQANIGIMSQNYNKNLESSTIVSIQAKLSNMTHGIPDGFITHEDLTKRDLATDVNKLDPPLQSCRREWLGTLLYVFYVTIDYLALIIIEKYTESRGVNHC